MVVTPVHKAPEPRQGEGEIWKQKYWELNNDPRFTFDHFMELPKCTFRLISNCMLSMENAVEPFTGRNLLHITEVMKAFSKY